MRTGLLGVIGYPVGHSVSPAMMNAALGEAGIHGVLYIAVEVKPRDLKSFVSSARYMNFIGFNVTIPHKVSVMRFLDRLDKSAKAVESVNVVKLVGERAVGYNTDVAGVAASVPEPDEGRAVVLGVGGAARAAAVALWGKGYDDLVFAGRRASSMDEFDRFARRKNIRIQLVRFGSRELSEAVKEAELLVNATPVGMFPKTNQSPIPSNIIHRDLTVFDMVYNPVQTKLLKTAKARGAKTIGGLRMLVKQGSEALKIWLGIEANEKTMEKAALKALGRRR
ncbi:MAG: shikimate dehydrogenase [Candidatus Caldarchaeum sp.]|nr:shikimate dehydrogenase [Candidatus Caldarchaeum sp.]